MAKPDGRVERGQSLKRAISATRWNDLCDAADIVHGRRGGVTAGGIKGPPLSYTPILVKNQSSSDVPKGGVLAVTGVAVSPTGAAGATQSVIVGDVPTNTTAGAYVVAVEPIAAGTFGTAAVAGVVQAKVEVNDDGHGYVTPKDGETEYLSTTIGGEGRIIWKAAATGAGVWALVNLHDKPTVTGTVITSVNLTTDALVFQTADIQFQSVLATGTETVNVTDCS